MKDILSYESDIWSCADLLISTGIKQSDFPKYMMPFFALIMLEGRMRNAMSEIEQTEGINRKNNPDGFVEAFKDMDCGYNGKNGKLDPLKTDEGDHLKFLLQKSVKLFIGNGV